MAALASAPSLPITSPPQPPQSSPSLKGIKKELSDQRRSSEPRSDISTLPFLRTSTDSLRLDKSPTLQSARSPSRDDGSTKSGSSGVRKLLPGHSKRQRKRIRDEELKVAAEEALRGRQPEQGAVTLPPALNGSATSLITNESDLDSPPSLMTRDSHSGYLTTSSPLIKSTALDNTGENRGPNGVNLQDSPQTEKFPTIVEPEPEPSNSINSSPFPRSPPSLASSPIFPAPGLIDKADTLQPDGRVDRSSSFSRLRGKSPARMIADKFSKSSRSARTSPDRKFADTKEPDATDLMRASTSFAERRVSSGREKRSPSPLRSQTLPNVDVPPPPKSAMAALHTDLEPPKTPPSAVSPAPLTTVTPPTPTEAGRGSLPSSPRIEQEAVSTDNESDTAVSPSSINISHRRIRSASSATHQKSKLSTSIIPPLTPTIEEVKTPTPGDKPAGGRSITPGGGFFSSWVSAAQNAASTITNLTNQSRSRSGTAASDPAKTKVPAESADDEAEPTEDDSPKKQLAVETMGTGNLQLSHLGFESLSDDKSLTKLDGSSRKVDAGLSREEAAAKIEDMLAKRAVSQAYERPPPSGEGTPVAEVPDPVASIKPVSTFDTTGTLTPPNGSIFEGETGPLKRSSSVRSKIHNRRSRGSSMTTGQSALSAMIGASSSALANPATGPRLSGFAVAPKQRNRAFHQQFRSVPDDDYLVEDYSCALQKEILLAGRLYISEGHICFSSNILGWVTTLIISFEEVVSIEKENTALVIPNAIAVQTLHARHTFRSLLSREATYDLMIGIWKVSHPDSFQKSLNSKNSAGESIKREPTAAAPPRDEVDEQDSDEESGEDSGADDDDAADESAPSLLGSSGSIASSDIADAKSVNRKVSGANIAVTPVAAVATVAPVAEATGATVPVVGITDAAVDFPGPTAHSPTDCTDKSTHYDKVIKDEIIPAPLGKIYSLLYGPQSGSFVRKFLEDGVSKAQELQMEDDKKGLGNDAKTRQYRYIKPLGGGIGPKQTNCITTENLDCFDLEKAVSVTCTTQTPDVPSGNAFSTKTRYCLTWAPGNATRFQMNMTIEWTAKSWLKGPIEKGALDGQTQYGDDLVKTLKTALGRTRAATTGSKVGKGKKKRKVGKKERTETLETVTKREENWGIFEPVRLVLGPAIDVFKPFTRMEVVVGILSFMVVWMWIRGGSVSSQAVLPFGQPVQRLAAYEQLWRQEENGLWEWLEQRVRIDPAIVRDHLEPSGPTLKQRKQQLQSKQAGIRLRAEKQSLNEMQEAVRVTRERLEAVQDSLNRQRLKAGSG